MSGSYHSFNTIVSPNFQFFAKSIFEKRQKKRALGVCKREGKGSIKSAAEAAKLSGLRQASQTLCASV